MLTLAFKQSRWPGLALDTLLLLGLAIGTVNRYAPVQISGDVMLYSVMSLQKVTLFFWAQNRLLNVGPALTTWIHDPAANLWANLLFPALVFYGLLRSWASVAIRLITNGSHASNADTWLARTLFLLLAATVLLVLQPHAIYEVVVWHVEYPLSCLLLLWACDLWFGIDDASAGSNTRLQHGRRLAGTLLLGLAIGVNFSIAIPALALVGGRVLIQRNLTRHTLSFALLTVILLLLWLSVARAIPGPKTGAYAEFSLATLRAGLPQVIGSLLSATWLPGLAGLLATLVTGRLLQLWHGRAPKNTRTRWMQGLLLLFALAWLLLFGGNTWVRENHFNYRYFIFVLLALTMMLSLEMAKLLLTTNRFLKSGVAALAGLVIGIALTYPLTPLQQYAFSQRLSPFMNTGATLYAGDFNLAWSAVVLGMLRGQPAFGLAGRAEGNAHDLQQHVAKMLERDGFLRVVCLQETADNCVMQANKHVGLPMRLRESQFISGRMAAWNLLLEPGVADSLHTNKPKADHWHYQGGDLASQPGLVGDRNAEGVRSLGEAGFLLYGPYRPASAGTYRLRMFGHALQTQTAWVDVAARGGNVQYAKFPLVTGESLLLDEFIHLPNDELDLEVRVYVGSSDVLQITGYTLEHQNADRK